MRFTSSKRRQPPAVIIISLIDIMIVMLIFLMVTTVFKEHPAIKLKLPESREAQEGVSGNQLVLTIPKDASFYYLGKVPVTPKALREKLVAEVQKNPQIGLSIRADKEASIQQFFDVLGAAKAAGIKPSLDLVTEAPKAP